MSAATHRTADRAHPCLYCGADSDQSHVPACRNYGLYDDHGKPVPARPAALEDDK